MMMFFACSGSGRSLLTSIGIGLGGSRVPGIALLGSGRSSSLVGASSGIPARVGGLTKCQGQRNQQDKEE